MSPWEVLRSALRGMAANRLRSVLTLLGVLIGVGSVILLVGVGSGSAQAVADRIGALGTTTLTVRSSGGTGGIRTQALTLEVADALAEAADASAIEGVVPQVTGSQTVSVGTESTTAQVVGTTAGYFDVTGSPVAQGVGLTENDVTLSRRVVVLGAELAETLYGEDDPVGQTLVIGSTPYLVNGVMAAKDSAGLQSVNDALVMPISRMQQSISGYGSLSSILLQAADEDSVGLAQAQAEQVLDAELRVDDADDAPYTISDQAQLLSTQGSTTSTFAAMLAAVAGISLLVGGIGVTNIMLVSVTERTREIGIRKALGATRGSILAQFLTEATLLSLLGGVLGVAVALAGSRMPILGVQPVIVGSSVVVALAVSCGIGVFFGGYPAWRAAALRPVEALRHE